MKTETTSLMDEIAELTKEAAAALERGELERAFALKQEVDVGWQRVRKLGQRATHRPKLSKTLSMRERAIAAVSALTVPSSPKLISAYCEAQTGESFDLKAIASIRRDEQRSWESGSARDTYLVPALEGPWFVAGRGRFALSHWPLWQRIVGPLSPRVDHLKVCVHLCNQIDSLGSDSDALARFRSLLVDYARTVPAALANIWDAPESIEVDRVRDAAETELNVIRDEDEMQRKREAERAARNLDATQQMWGGKPLQVFDDRLN